MAGTIGLVQNDIKRVLAYSTVSQLGYMFLAMGVGAFAGGIFHLYTHAFFKALLFLGSGAVIHALHGEQDLRNMGGLKKELPITYWTFLIGTLAIAGRPVRWPASSRRTRFSGRRSRSGHTVLWAARGRHGVSHGDVHVPAAVHGVLRRATCRHWARPGAGTTAHAHPAPTAPRTRTPAPSTWHARRHGIGLHDAPPAMAIALVVLAIGSVAGRVRRRAARARRRQPDRGVPRAELPCARRVEQCRCTAAAAAGEHHADTGTELALMALSTLVALAGIGLATSFFLQKPERADAMAARFSGLHRLLLNKYYVDEIYDAVIVQPIKRLSTGLLWRGVDAGLIDGTVNGVGLVVRGWSAVLRRLQTGSVRAYAMSIFVGVVAIVGYYLWR